MKRNSITTIIMQVQILMLDVVMSKQKDRAKYYRMICKAAVNEINRLEAETENVNEKVEYLKGYSDGYDKGFECAHLVERTNIKCDCLGEISDNQELICGNIKPIQP